MKFFIKFKFIIFSLFGIFMFFVPITLFGIKTIPIDHIVKLIIKIPYFITVYGIVLISLGAIKKIYDKTYKKTKLDILMTILNILGFIFCVMSISKIGPKIIIDDAMGVYVLYKVVLPVILIVPIGAVFLSFLVSYGLMECIGIIMEPIMRPIFKTPGRSAIDAVASFVGSYSLALLVTNRVFRENKYTVREAAIIATGFSTVSATFMIITLNTLDLMNYWNLYFWICLIVTFIVTAVTARIYPLSKMDNTYFDKSIIGNIVDEVGFKNNSKLNIFKRAYLEGIKNCEKSNTVLENTISNLKDGINLAINIGPTIMSIGVISLLLSQYTNIFDILGFIFYPITKILGANDPLLLSKASMITLADMYVPAIISIQSDIETKFIVATICITEILFFSASIPCILATDIPIKIRDIVLIWLERIIVSLIIVIPIAKLVF